MEGIAIMASSALLGPQDVNVNVMATAMIAASVILLSCILILMLLALFGQLFVFLFQFSCLNPVHPD
jgi:hypothetical protein